MKNVVIAAYKRSPFHFANKGGLTRVRYTSRKPPKAWKGTAAEKIVDLAKIASETKLYQGRADEGASR